MPRSFEPSAKVFAGTEMPANPFEDSETWALVAYLRSVSAASQTPVAGDSAQGERIFFGKGRLRRSVIW